MKANWSMTSTIRQLIGLVGLILVVGLGMLPNEVSAQVTCPNPANPQGDDDGDGFTNAQECQGITTGGAVPMTFPWCGSNPALRRDQCVDPNSKDLFVFYLPLTGNPASLLAGTVPTAVPNPFQTLTFYGVTFNALNDLRVTVHQLGVDQVTMANGVGTRVVMNPTTPGASPQKGIVVLEDLDNTGENLGYCQYGTPNGADSEVCSIFTQRILSYINTSCLGLQIETSSGVASSAVEVFKAYAVETILHEIGHAIGGLTSKFVTRYGGYHYAPGTLMEQFVTVSTKSNKCRVFISNGWNLSLDPASVRLK